MRIAQRTPDTSGYFRLIDDFIAGRMTAPEFQKSFLIALKFENRGLDDRLFDVLQRLFEDTDDYVAYPELRTDPEDLDDEQLRECAIRARRELRDLGYE
ncbi:colicin immunity domain-containing protein [Mycolicibacterium agri]|nr:colicin immunity domain-containing protein [Mycolicibacterium agri]